MTVSPIAHWWTKRMLAFDTETTQKEPELARLVTASLCAIGGGEPTQERSWLANSSVEIPAETTAIHGITTEMAKLGQFAPEVVAELMERIDEAWSLGVPLIIFNAPYDMTVLKFECARYGIKWFHQLGPIVDPLVIDRHYDRYRKGKRTLTALCEHYRAVNDGAHEAKSDALAAARVAWRQGTQIAHLAKHTLADLQPLQAAWYAEQGERLQKVFDDKGGAHRHVPLDWPLHLAAAA